MKVIIGVNYIMTVNQLPSIPMYWDCDNFVGTVGNIEYWYIVARAIYQEVLQNNHFADNTNQYKLDKGYKFRIIDHLNESFQAVFSNEPEQSMNI